MSRAMFLKLDVEDVVTKCDKNDIAISTVEELPSGGMRLVCQTSEGADNARILFKRHVLASQQRRTPLSIPGSRQ